ncbi:MAG: alpha/beta hydrolase family protein [Phototrophicaceae bacterium]
MDSTTLLPPRIEALKINSYNETLNGVIYCAGGTGLHPTILLLHGVPGYERNFDLAHAFVREGYHTVVFHYRGAWGSSGVFTLQHVVEDVEQVLNFLREDAVAEHFLIDRERLICVGHSMGGWATLVAGGRGWVNHACSIAGVWVGGLHDYILQHRETFSSVLNFPSEDRLLQEWQTYEEEWDFFESVPQLAHKNLLLIGGSRDEDVPIALNHTPLVTALERQPSHQVRHYILDAEHSFIERRLELISIILEWLRAI